MPSYDEFNFKKVANDKRFKDIKPRLDILCPKLNDPKRKYPITNNDYNWVVLNTLTDWKVAELVEA